MMISDLESEIAEKIFIKIENWNLYLGDAGLARKLAIECISNLEKGTLNAAKISLDSIYVKIGDNKDALPLTKFITSNQISDLEELLNQLT
tara:strand:- start:82 stop:354 length:273 start_codon:yes stop_codon:yes gene_type:complete